MSYTQPQIGPCAAGETYTLTLLRTMCDRPKDTALPCQSRLQHAYHLGLTLRLGDSCLGQHWRLSLPDKLGSLYTRRVPQAKGQTPDYPSPYSVVRRAPALTRLCLPCAA